MELAVKRVEGGSLSIAYEDLPPLGEVTGPPVLLIHGFASSRRTNWQGPGWYRVLHAVGRRIIALDLRGHGESGVSHDSEDYDEGILAADCAAVLDACRVGQADVMGYSMGAMVTIRLLMDRPQRVRRAVLAGLGDNFLQPPAFSDAVPAALLADDPSTITDPEAKGFRTFADAQRQDRAALAACWRRPRTAPDAGKLAAIANPVLVICGERDSITGTPGALAATMPKAIARIVPGRDHMTAVGDKATKAEVLEFLEG